jgi:hypothetical protein
MKFVLVFSLCKNIENAYKILNREPHKKSPFERTRLGWGVIKWNVKKDGCKDANLDGGYCKQNPLTNFVPVMMNILIYGLPTSILSWYVTNDFS